MHFAFIPYGKRSEVELLFRDMEAQKHLLKLKNAKEEKGIYIQGQLRQLPLGVYEYVFPREDLDLVLNTLIGQVDRYGISGIVIKFIKKYYKLKNIPEYKKDKHLLWIKDHVEIIPLGIREDIDIFDDKIAYTHEAI